MSYHLFLPNAAALFFPSKDWGSYLHNMQINPNNINQH